MDRFTIPLITFLALYGWIFHSENIETVTYLAGWLVIGFGIFWSVRLWKNSG